MLLNIILSWFGVARASLFNRQCRLTTQNYHAYHVLRTYLVFLRQETPHQAVKDEIDGTLDKAAAYFHIDSAD